MGKIRTYLPILALLIACIFSFAQAQAEILFEGYYKVSAYGQYLGYYITRYETDATKNQFKHTYFLRLTQKGVDVTESLRAVSDMKFNPISFELTSLIGKSIKMIDAKFKKEQMTGQITENGKKTKLSLNLSPDTILSSSLYYKIMAGPNDKKNNKNIPGLQVGTKYSYPAIAEDSGQLFNCVSSVAGKMVTYGKQDAFKAVNDFAGTKYENYMTTRGEILAAYTPATGMAVDLTGTPEEATNGTPVPADALKKLFGEVPKGISNQLMAGGLKQIPDSTPEKQLPAKTMPSNANQGVIQKSTPSNTQEEGK